MLRELNLNEMEMVAGGDNTADCPPIIVNGGTTRGESERQNQILQQILRELENSNVDTSSLGFNLISVADFIAEQGSDVMLTINRNNNEMDAPNERNDVLDIRVTPLPGNLDGNTGEVRPPNGGRVFSIGPVNVISDGTSIGGEMNF